MPVDHKEIAFESAIEHSLLEGPGHSGGNPGNYDRKRGIDPTVVIPFIQETQQDQWKAIESLHGADAENVLLEDLCKNLDSQGSLNVLRHGFKCFGKQFQMAYFQPASGLNPDTQKLYEANRLTVTRQLPYNPSTEETIDLVISLNGIPIVTAELKNPLTGQNVNNAKSQYRTDRDHRQKLFEFKKRALVHFAVDPDEVYMATRLSGRSTYFLPFNKGYEGGAGNPPNPNGYKTAYLWEEVLTRDSLLDILARFMHLQVEEKEVDGKKVKKETMIFPRYHQLDAVRQLVKDAGDKGAGTNYLVMHSAGSGKSNSIAWLAHRLSSLHNDQDERVFDSVVVITDRVVLDRQLQDTIYQFEHKQGVVEKIDEDSTQLAEALKSGTPIIITTLQKFPFVTDKVGDLPGRKYAVIVDEAHSSQSGESAAELKGVLGGAAIKEKAKQEAEDQGLPDYEEEILRTMAKRGKQPNISFFAFTATPKHKTMEVFGHPGTDGLPAPFHVYSMKQAIQERFILDVLKNYTTYKTFYRLIKSIEDDPEVDKKKAGRALARFTSLHPYNIAQKTEVMVEHFRHSTKHKIGGRAKAMVVTGSRLHAVRYKLAFDEYIREKGYKDLATLVAFSGEVKDPDLPEAPAYTEVGMNGGKISQSELPKKFGTDQYHVLIVAEKYQTGFDQPLLHTMYVDKRLAGVQCVQTLSRLNRTASGKDDTFVLDFVNEPDDVYEAFKPYYEHPLMGEQADPQQLYDLQARLDEMHVYYKDDVEDYCRIYFKPNRHVAPTDQGHLNSILDKAVTRFADLDEETKEEFRGLLVSYRNLYSFLAQIIPFQDSDLEKLFTYVRFLLKKLPARPGGPNYHFDDEVDLKYYRLQKIHEGRIQLDHGEAEPLKGPTEVGTGVQHDDMVELSRLIDLLNERFGTEFTDADELFFEQIREDAVADEQLQQAAKANTVDNFRYVFEKALESLLIDRMDSNEGIVAKILNEQEFQRQVSEHLMHRVYSQIRGQVGDST